MSQGVTSKKAKNEVKKVSQAAKTAEVSSCSRPQCVEKGLEIFGDAWTLFIVSSLAEGEKRFCELQRVLGNLNPVTLTSRLKKMEKLGFVERKTEKIDKLSVSYALTKKGFAMLPVLREIENYAKKYLE